MAIEGLRVAVTGLGVLSPSGIGISEFWNNIVAGKSYISSFDDFPEFALNSRVVGRIKNFDHKKFGISDRERKRMGRPVQLAVAAAEEAVQEARLNMDCIENKEKMGVCIACAIADTPASERQFMELVDYYRNQQNYTEEELSRLLHEDLFTRCTFNFIATEIAARYQLKGDVVTMSTGCVSGIDAIGSAYDSIKHGDMDLMICGSSEAPVTLLTLASFDVIGATSKKNHSPREASSPFDLSRDGFVLSEGAGLLILEEWEHAVSRGAPIYAEIVGYETNNNAWHMTSLPEDGEPITSIMKRALKKADLEPGNVDHINAHGSSTPQNDIFETAAYKKVFGDYAYQIPIGANKSIIGHPLAAASAIEIVRSCLILREGIIPPTINLNNFDEKCDLDYVPLTPRKKDVEVIMTNANGFSGIHSVMIMKKIKEVS